MKKDKQIEKITPGAIAKVEKIIKYYYGDEAPEDWSDEDERCEAHKCLTVLKRLLK